MTCAGSGLRGSLAGVAQARRDARNERVHQRSRPAGWGMRRGRHARRGHMAHAIANMPGRD